MFEEFYKSVGIRVPLDKFKETLIEQNKKFVEVKNIETFSMLGWDIGDILKSALKKKNVGALLIVPNGVWYPINSSGGSGCSGSSDENSKPIWNMSLGLPNSLTTNDIKKVCEKYDGYNKTFRFKKHYAKSYSLEHRSDCNKDEFWKCYEELRSEAQKKLDKMPKTKKYTYFINDVKFEYEVNVKRALGSYSEDITNSYYFYDKKGEYIDSIGNHGAIYG